MSIVSVNEAEKVLGWSRPTINKWMDDPTFPIHKKPTTKGQPFQLDTAKVIAWMVTKAVVEAEDRVKRAVEKEQRMRYADDGGETEEQAKTRRARADANLAEFKEADAAGASIPKAVVIEVMRAERVAVRNKFENFGNIVATRTAKMTDPALIQKTCDKLVRENFEAFKEEPFNG